jgi:hypothetical protein
LTQVDAKIVALQKENPVNLSAFYREENGSAQGSPDQVKHWCNYQGYQLPSARQMALYAQSRGAKGIRETKFPGMSLSSPSVRAESDQNIKEGYHAVYKDNAVLFYFNGSGYDVPESLHFSNPSTLWTSTEDDEGSTWVIVTQTEPRFERSPTQPFVPGFAGARCVK